MCQLELARSESDILISDSAVAISSNRSLSIKSTMADPWERRRNHRPEEKDVEGGKDFWNRKFVSDRWAEWYDRGGQGPPPPSSPPHDHVALVEVGAEGVEMEMVAGVGNGENIGVAEAILGGEEEEEVVGADQQMVVGEDMINQVEEDIADAGDVAVVDPEMVVAGDGEIVIEAGVGEDDIAGVVADEEDNPEAELDPQPKRPRIH